MRVCDKRAFSFLLTLVLVIGSFAGTGITAKAVSVLWNISVDKGSLESSGGTVTVKVNGDDLGENVWWGLRKKTISGGYEIVGEEVRETPTNGSDKPEFSVEIPENELGTEVVYEIRVQDTKPQNDWLSGGYKWSSPKTCEVTVAAKQGGTVIIDKSKLQEAIAKAPTQNDNVYTSTTWAALQAALTGAQEIANKEDAAQDEVDEAVAALNEAIAGLKKIEANITGMTVSQDTVPADGETIVDVQVTGTDMTSDNWELEAKKYYHSSDAEATGKRVGSVEVTEKTAQGAKVKITANNTKNPLNIKFFAGPKDEGEADGFRRQQSRTIVQEGNKKASVTIKLVDEDKNPVTASELGLSSEDEEFIGSPNSHPSPLTKTDSGFVFEKSLTVGAVYRVTLDENTLGYSAEPMKIEINNSSLITKINGQPYDGTPVEMTVRTDTSGENPPEDDPELEAIALSAESLGSSGGTINVSVTGKNLSGSIWYQVRKQTGVVNGAPVYEANAQIKSVSVSDSSHFVFPVVIPKNIEKERVVYQIRITATEPSGTVMNGAKAKIVTVEGVVTDTSENVDDKPAAPPVKVSRIKLSAVSKKIAAGKKVQIKAEVFPVNAADKAVIYKSSNTKYATVNASGKVTLKKAGAGKTVIITAMAADGSGKKAAYKISIMKDSVKSIKLKAAKTVKAGKKLRLKVNVKTTGKKVNKKLRWTSSDTKYATVSSGGVVTAKKAGKGKTIKITAAATDGSNKKCTVKIKIK